MIPVMRWDRDRLRAALMAPLSEDARDAALALGAVGTLDDVPPLEQARAAARRYYEELVARRSTGGDRLRAALREIVNGGGRA